MMVGAIIGAIAAWLLAACLLAIVIGFAIRRVNRELRDVSVDAHAKDDGA